MSNSWLAGQLAKSITQKKRPRWFWNVFCISITIILLIISTVLSHDVLSDHIKREEYHTYQGYDDSNLITDNGYYEIAELGKQEVKIEKMLSEVDVGDPIVMVISRISGELLEVKQLGVTVYKKESSDLIAFILLAFLLIFPFLVFFVFMLIATNIRNPGYRILKFRKSYLMIIHKNNTLK